MKINRRLLRMVASLLSVIMLFSAFGATFRAEAGLFSKIKETVTKHPLATVAVAGGAILAAPYIASALGAATGVAVVGKAGAVAAVAGAGSGLLGIGAAIWGGVVAAGGFVVGALGAFGAGIASMFTGIAGWIAGIFASPLFIPALVVVGCAVAAYFLWKKYRRQTQDISNGSNLPTVSTSVGVPSGNTTVTANQGANPYATQLVPMTSQELPVTNSTTPQTPAADATPVTPAADTSKPATGAVNTSDALKTAHSDYIKAYNAYISLVTNIGGSENPDEELRTNMRRSDVQNALTAYRESYNKYITMLRQSNAQ
ncbi:MAG: hypothetical protein HQM10_07695 [Candidatus Riflebacteria bacterium]|nr:hypothetical protein [Candidatus Riflebacteria bacterium]